MVALILANKDELISLSNLASGIDAFTSFCQTVTVPYMKRILLLHCSKELRDIFQLDQGFVQEEDKEGIGYSILKSKPILILATGVLDLIYPKLLLSVNEVNQNRTKLGKRRKGVSELEKSASNVTINDSNSVVSLNDSASGTDNNTENKIENNIDNNIDDDITEEDKRRLVLADGIYIGQLNDKNHRHGHGKFIFNETSSMAGHTYVGDWQVTLLLILNFIIIVIFIIKNYIIIRISC